MFLKNTLNFGLCDCTLQDLPKPVRANFILNVETDELFITAGLQDRVVQVDNLISTNGLSSPTAQHFQLQ